MLVWLIAAVGVIGIEGDRADLMYFAVLAIGISGAIVARFQPEGMASAMFVTAAAIVLVGVIALMLGKHESPITSVFEILGLTGMFAALFAGSAWLFRIASAQQSRADTGPR
jgi:CHASE2 domain-containing sensor protein